MRGERRVTETDSGNPNPLGSPTHHIKKKLMFSLLMFFCSGWVYALFELYAPYCAKHVCCSSSGGFWAFMPLLAVLFLCIGFYSLILGVLYAD